MLFLGRFKTKNLIVVMIFWVVSIVKSFLPWELSAKEQKLSCILVIQHRIMTYCCQHWFISCSCVGIGGFLCSWVWQESSGECRMFKGSHLFWRKKKMPAFQKKVQPPLCLCCWNSAVERNYLLVIYERRCMFCQLLSHLKKKKKQQNLKSVNAVK